MNSRGPLKKRARAFSGSPFEATIGFCRAIRVGDRVIVSGTAPIWPDGSVELDEYLQARRCFEIIEAALTELGGRMQDVVRTRIFVTSIAWIEGVSRAHGEIFGAIQPAATMVVVKELLNEHWRVEIEAEAVVT